MDISSYRFSNKMKDRHPDSQRPIHSRGVIFQINNGTTLPGNKKHKSKNKHMKYKMFVWRVFNPVYEKEGYSKEHKMLFWALHSAHFFEKHFHKWFTIKGYKNEW